MPGGSLGACCAGAAPSLDLGEPELVKPVAQSGRTDLELLGQNLDVSGLAPQPLRLRFGINTPFGRAGEVFAATSPRE